MQTTDKHDVATLADWRVGDKVIVPPVEARMNDESMGCVDFYFCEKEI